MEDEKGQQAAIGQIPPTTRRGGEGAARARAGNSQVKIQGGKRSRYRAHPMGQTSDELISKSERLELDSGHDEHGLYILMSLAVDGG